MLDDLLAGAQILARSAPACRDHLARKMLSEAHAAHHFMRRMGRPHPQWGNGSLMARAYCDGFVPSRPLCLLSLAVMALAVARFRDENALRRGGL